MNEQRSMIKAKPTVYKNIPFRSRLEAKWAIFFDEMGIDYRYEPGIYKVPINGYFMKYCPDFALLNVKTQQEIQLPIYVEIKGVNHYYEIDEKNRKILESFGSSNSLLVLGSFPMSINYLYQEPDHLSNFFLVNGQDMPCFFTQYDGVPWLVDKYRVFSDSRKTDDALWMACNACFEDANSDQNSDWLKEG